MRSCSPRLGRFDSGAAPVHRIEDGKIVEHWSDVDSYAMMLQLGLVTPPGADAGPKDESS